MSSSSASPSTVSSSSLSLLFCQCQCHCCRRHCCLRWCRWCRSCLSRCRCRRRRRQSICRGRTKTEKRWKNVFAFDSGFKFQGQRLFSVQNLKSSRFDDDSIFFPFHNLTDLYRKLVIFFQRGAIEDTVAGAAWRCVTMFELGVTRLLSREQRCRVQMPFSPGPGYKQDQQATMSVCKHPSFGWKQQMAKCSYDNLTARSNDNLDFWTLDHSAKFF